MNGGIRATILTFIFFIADDHDPIVDTRINEFSMFESPTSATFLIILLSAWSLHIMVWLYERSDAYSFLVQPLVHIVGASYRL